jgi:L-rhamnonate dehydratase
MAEEPPVENPRIVRIEWGTLEGRRPRKAGSNARLGEHGIAVRVPIARLTTEDGASGFGACRAARDVLAALVGVRLDDAFSADRGVAEA